MLYTGFYINLDRNEERRRAVESQLAACNLLPFYQRFPAALGNTLNVSAPKLSPGVIGCFTSHYLLLQSLKETHAHVHIIEDDIVLSPHTGPVINTMAQSGLLDGWDLVYTDIWVPVSVDVLRELGELFRAHTTLNPDGTPNAVKDFTLLDLKQRIFASTVSYVVNKNSLSKVAAFLAEAMQSGLSLPIDLFYRQLIYQGRLRAACIFPFVTSVNIEENRLSNISNTGDTRLQLSILASTMVRNLFYIHSDPKQLQRIARQYLGNGEPDARDQVALDILRFASSPKFKSF